MGQYGKIKCPVCGTSIETLAPLEYCPVCKAYIGDKLHLQGGGTGIHGQVNQRSVARPPSGDS